MWEHPYLPLEGWTDAPFKYPHWDKEKVMTSKKKNVTRVNRSTLLLLRVLARILREMLELPEATEECWTIEHRISWDEYPRPQDFDDLDMTVPYADDWVEWQLEQVQYTLTRWTGFGQAEMLFLAGNYQLRTLIEKIDFVAAGNQVYYTFHVWTRNQEGAVQGVTCEYWPDDGKLVIRKKGIKRIPRRLEFRRPVDASLAPDTSE